MKSKSNTSKPITPQQWQSLLSLPSNPERVADYYPLLTSIEKTQGGSLLCYSRIGNSLISKQRQCCFKQLSIARQQVYRSHALTPSLADAQCLSAQVAGFFGGNPQRVWFTMEEDWLFIPLDDGRLQLIKVWLNLKITKRFLGCLPMHSIVRLTAKLEHKRLAQGWAEPIKAIHQQ